MADSCWCVERKPQNSAKQLSFNLKNKKREKKSSSQTRSRRVHIRNLKLIVNVEILSVFPQNSK